MHGPCALEHFYGSPPEHFWGWLIVLHRYIHAHTHLYGTDNHQTMKNDHDNDEVRVAQLAARAKQQQLECVLSAAFAAVRVAS